MVLSDRLYAGIIVAIASGAAILAVGLFVRDLMSGAFG